MRRPSKVDTKCCQHEICTKNSDQTEPSERQLSTNFCDTKVLLHTNIPGDTNSRTAPFPRFPLPQRIHRQPPGFRKSGNPLTSDRLINYRADVEWQTNPTLLLYYPYVCRPPTHNRKQLHRLQDVSSASFLHCRMCQRECRVALKNKPAIFYGHHVSFLRSTSRRYAGTSDGWTEKVSPKCLTFVLTRVFRPPCAFSAHTILWGKTAHSGPKKKNLALYVVRYR